MPIGAPIRRAVAATSTETTNVAPWSTAVVIYDDATTACSTTEQRSPFSITKDQFHWLQITPDVTRVILRARAAGTATTFTTSPIVRPVGLVRTAGTPGDPGTAITAANFTPIYLLGGHTNNVTMAFGAGVNANMTDGSVFYSTPLVITSSSNSTLGVGTLGCEYIGCIVQTAAAVTDGASPVVVAIEAILCGGESGYQVA